MEEVDPRVLVNTEVLSPMSVNLLRQIDDITVTSLQNTLSDPEMTGIYYFNFSKCQILENPGLKAPGICSLGMVYNNFLLHMKE